MAERRSENSVVDSELEVVLAEHRHALQAILDDWITKETGLIKKRLSRLNSDAVEASCDSSRFGGIGSIPKKVSFHETSDFDYAHVDTRRKVERRSGEQRRSPKQGKTISSLDLVLEDSSEGYLDGKSTRKSTKSEAVTMGSTNKVGNDHVIHTISVNAHQLARQINENAGINLAGSDEEGFQDSIPLHLIRNKEGDKRAWYVRVCEHALYDVFIACVIIANACSITIAVDIAARNYTEPEPEVFEIVECAFFVFYCFEVALKLVAYGKKFFYGLDSAYNWFDLLLIAISLPDRIIYLQGSGGGANVSFIRLLRLTKLVRMGRIGRLLRRSLYLRLILKLMFTGTRNIIPMLSLVVLMIYVFSILILTLVANFLRDDWQTMPSAVKYDLIAHWGSLKSVMLSSFMACSGGAEWSRLGSSLEEVGTFCYALFVFFVAFSMFIITNVITCCFIQFTILLIENADRFKVSVQMARHHQLVEIFIRLSGLSQATYHEFHVQLKDNEAVATYFSDVLGVSSLDADYLFYALSASGTEVVSVATFILGCIELKGPVTKMDLMRMKTNLDVALEEYSANHMSPAPSIGSAWSSAGKYDLEVVDLPWSQLQKQVLLRISSKVTPRQAQKDFISAAKDLVDVAFTSASGGCGFVMTTHKGYASLKNRYVDFQVVDRDARFPDGYMTQRLRETLVSSQAFRDAMVEFTGHIDGDGDRWPAEHEAHGCPKDGFTALTMSGKTLKSAARIAGLPTPPCRWDGVGTRHLAALAVTWALRLYPSFSIVRSDSGSVHCLWAEGAQIMAVKIIDDRQSTDVEI